MLLAPGGANSTLSLIEISGDSSGVVLDGAPDGRYDLDIVSDDSAGFWAEKSGAVATLIVGRNRQHPVSGARPAKAVPCSGFLVSQDLLMTSAHCFKSESTFCDQTVAVFGYRQSDGKTLSRKCLEVEYLNGALDIVLLRLSSVETDQPFILVRQTPPSSAEIVIIQHPRGSVQMVSVEGCKIEKSIAASIWLLEGVQRVDLDRVGFEHSCDTASGSSGSPVLGPEGVVGVHQGELPGRNVGVRSVKIFSCIKIDRKTNEITVKKPADPVCENKI